MNKDDELLRIKMARARATKVKTIASAMAIGVIVLLVQKAFDEGFVIGSNMEALKHQ
jgi:hypothetical protein